VLRTIGRRPFEVRCAVQRKAITREELRGTRPSMLHESGTICFFGSYRKYLEKTPSEGNAAAQSWSPIGKVIERCFPIRHGISLRGSNPGSESVLDHLCHCSLSLSGRLTMSRRMEVSH
jgi:hypothetical protein